MVVIPIGLLWPISELSGDGDVFRHGDSLFFQHGDDGERDLVVVADGGIDGLFAVEQHGKHQGRFGFPVFGVKPDDVFGIIRDSTFLQRLHVAFMALGALAVVGLEDFVGRPLKGAGSADSRLCSHPSECRACLPSGGSSPG